MIERTQLSQTVKDLRKEYALTQEDLAMKSGVGLNFVRNLEQGKTTLRMDKVNQLLDLFNYTLMAMPRYSVANDEAHKEDTYETSPHLS